MARRAAIIDSLEAKQTPYIHLDLGNFMNTQEHVEDLKSRFIWETLAEQNVLATTPGPRELAEFDLYREFLDDGKITVISSNLSLVEGGSRRPLGVRYQIVEVAGVKVGLFGLIGGNQFANAQIPIDVSIEFEDPFDTAREISTLLGKRADVVVLMSQMSSADTDKLLETVPGIDIALYGYRASWVQHATKVGSTIVNRTSMRGQYLGHLVTIIDPDGEIIEFGDRNAPLTKEWPKAEETLARVDEVVALSKEVIDTVREESRKEYDRNVSGERYLGVLICKRCHESQYEQWVKTPHAEAFATLQTDHGMEMDADCTSCHVTGWDEPWGYKPQSSKPDLRGVQCESCHGPGTQHERTGEEVRVDKKVCVTCHTGDFGKDFDYDTYLEAVVH